MSILKQLHNDFSIDASEPAASEASIRKLKKFTPISIPPEYEEIIQVATEVEIAIQKKMYIRIWSPEGCIEMNQAYKIQEYIPESLAIGDDQGGYALIYMTGTQGFGLYLSSFGDLDGSEVSFIASSLRELLVEGVGIDILLENWT